MLDSEEPAGVLEIRSGQEVVKLTEGKEHQPSLRQSHEVLAQRLYSIILAADTAQSALYGNPERLPHLLGFINEQSEAALEELRRLASESFAFPGR